MSILEALSTFNRIIEHVEDRCLATDGPVTPTLKEMEEDELAALWRAAKTIHSSLIAAPPPTAVVEKLRADLRSYEITFNAMYETMAERDVVAERMRQKSGEGFDETHDDQHTHGQLADAASCYALCAHDEGELLEGLPEHWPWADSRWSRGTPRRMLVIAGALILAEIERLDRAEAAKSGASQ